MSALGLGLACEASTGRMPPNLAPQGVAERRLGLRRRNLEGQGYALRPLGNRRRARHFDWGYFPNTVPTFPEKLTTALIERGKLPGILGNKHASGTDIIDEFGAEHMRTGKPICYTSVDSVLQIAAHEETSGCERLYDLCQHRPRALRPNTRSAASSPVPSSGTREAGFKRTGNRKDFATPPPTDTILDTLGKAGPRRGHRRQDRRHFRPSRARAGRSSRMATMPACPPPSRP